MSDHDLHASHDCQHELSFCKPCDKAYCKKCGKEWSNPSWHYVQPWWQGGYAVKPKVDPNISVTWKHSDHAD